MNNFDILIKLLFPAILLIAWALNQVLNKEGAPAQPRQPMGPRPGGLPPAPRPLDRMREMAEAQRRASAPTVRPQPSAADEVIIIRSENLRTPLVSPARNNPAARPQAGRRGTGRGRQTQQPQTARRAEPTAGRAATLGGTIATTLDVRPLSELQATPAGLPSSSVPLLIGVMSTPGSIDLQRALTDPARIREAMLLSEILKPPVSLRRSRPRGNP